MSPALQTVHVRVNDTATGKPTPVRIRFTDSVGNYFAPMGRLTHFHTERGQDVGGNVYFRGREFAYIDGTCEIRLPHGPIIVTVHKGLEYDGFTELIHLAPGQLSLRLKIGRIVDFRAERWYSGDTRSHFLSLRAALLEGAAEDLAIVNVLAEQRADSIPNILEYSGQAPALENHGCAVVVNTRNYHSELGALLLLNTHRLVFPLTFGGPDGYDDWTLADWCDQCHRKGGLVVGDELLVSEDPRRGEVLADLILGKVDALQFTWPDPGTPPPISALEEWMKLLNAGFRVPLVAGSGKDSNAAVLGGWRTYARLRPGEPITYKNWIEAVRAGRTFISREKHLFLTVNGNEPGDVIDVPSPDTLLCCHAEAVLITSFDPGPAVEVLYNGRAAEWETGQNQCALRADQGGWLAARCWTSPDSIGKTVPDAQTSPVYVRVAGRQPPCPPEVLSDFQGHLAKMLEWIDAQGRFQTPAQRERLRSVFTNAREVLSAR